MKKSLLILLMMYGGIVFGQVSVGSTTPDKSAQLDVVATNKGMLVPRVVLTSSTDATTIASPATSLLVYNTATAADVIPGYHYWDGAKWQQLTNKDALQAATDLTKDAWVDNATDTRIELGTKSDGTTARDAGTEVSVDDNGNMLFGSTVAEPIASRKVQAHGDLAYYTYGDFASTYGIVAHKARGTAAAPVAVNPGDVIGTNYMLAYDGSNFDNSAISAFRVSSDWDGTQTRIPSEYIIQLSNGSGRPTRFKIASNGDTDVYGTLSVSDLTGTTDSSSDVVVVADATTGELKAAGKITELTSSTEPWYGIDDNKGATENTENIYHKGSVKITDGSNNDPSYFDLYNLTSSMAFNVYRYLDTDAKYASVTESGIMTLKHNKPTDFTGSSRAGNFINHTDAASTVNYRNLTGVAGDAGHYGSGNVDLLSATSFSSFLRQTGGNVNNLYGVNSYARNLSTSSTVTNLVGVRTGLSTSGGTVTNSYGFYLDDLTSTANAASVTNGYGVYLEDIKANTAYGMYQAGADDDNYFAGNVGIGTTTPSEKLEVNGAIKTAGATYPDYVFENYVDGSSKINKTYTFKTLNEVENFIKANKHLPGVTSIKELTKTKEGYSFNITELSTQTLEKVEELFLHTIEQEKKINSLKSENQQLKDRLAKIEAKLGLKN